MAVRPVLEEVVPQVKRNSSLSDARYWGYYTTCGLLLRLREQYMFENGIKPWEKAEMQDIARWIGERESLWKDLEGLEFSPIRIGREEFGPFEAGRINEVLLRDRALYGAGYGLYGKPVFFVSELAGHEVIGGYDVYISGKEYARDMSMHPAMLQGRTIFARKEITELLIWEKFGEYAAKNTKGVLSTAFAFYGASPGMDTAALEEKMEGVAESELRTYIRHEVGEAAETERLGPLWPEMLSSIISSRAAVLVRAVKDTLADTSQKGMLKYIIESENTGSLAFYMAFLTGYRRPLAREITGAFKNFTETGNWQDMERARTQCYERTKGLADLLLGIYRREKDPGVLQGKIEEQISSHMS